MNKIKSINIDDLKDVSGGYWFALKPRCDKAGRQIVGEYDTVLITTPSEDLCLIADTSWMNDLPSTLEDKNMLFDAGINVETIESYLKMKCLQRHGFKDDGFGQ